MALTNTDETFVVEEDAKDLEGVIKEVVEWKPDNLIVISVKGDQSIMRTTISPAESHVIAEILFEMSKTLMKNARIGKH